MKSIKRKSEVLLLLIVLLIVAIKFYNAQPDKNAVNIDISGDLRVHFIDVGQADSTLIELPDGKNMLIDAGNNDDGNFVVDYIENLGISKLDFVVGTHPHEDHIGGLDDVINAFDVGSVYMPKVQTNTKTFHDVLQAVKNNGLSVKTAKAGVVLAQNEDYSLYMLAPVSAEYEEINNYSAVIRLEYKDTAFLFTGDAEEVSESEILENVQADVLKVGHHGSSSSTTPEFLLRVNPVYAYIPCGKDNSYGHPHRETLKHLNESGVEIYRADTDGTVIFVSDGNRIGVVK